MKIITAIISHIILNVKMNFDGKNPYCTSRKDKNSQKLPAKIPYYERAKQDVYDHQGLKQDGKSAAEKRRIISGLTNTTYVAIS